MADMATVTDAQGNDEGRAAAPCALIGLCRVTLHRCRVLEPIGIDKPEPSPGVWLSYVPGTDWPGRLHQNRECN